MGVPFRSPGPRAVVVEGFTSLALNTGGVMPTFARQLPFPVERASTGVSIALASASDGEVRQRVELFLRPGLVALLLMQGAVRAASATAAGCGAAGDAVQPAEDDAYVRGGDEVLEDGTGVEVLRRRPALEGDERHAGPRLGGLGTGVQLGADGLLLVGPRDRRPRGAVVYLPALARVELERGPSPPVINALVDDHRFRSRVTELQTDVRHLELLSEAEGQRDVARVLDARFRHPAGDVVRVVEVRQVSGGMTAARSRRVAFEAGRRGGGRRGATATLAASGAALCSRGIAVAGGRAAAATGARRLYRPAEGGVDEVGDAAAWMAVFVVAGVDGVGRRRKREPVDESGCADCDRPKVRGRQDGRREEKRKRRPMEKKEEVEDKRKHLLDVRSLV